MEVIGAAVAKFFDCIDASGLEEFGELGPYAFDSAEVGHISPSKNAFAVDACFFFEFFAAFGGSCFFEQLFYCFNALGFEFCAVSGANTFEFFDFCHDNVVDLNIKKCVIRKRLAE